MPQIDSHNPFEGVSVFQPEFWTLLNDLAAGVSEFRDLFPGKGVLKTGSSLSILDEEGSVEAGATGEFFPVKVTTDGGSAGGKTTRCTFTYTVTTLDGEELGKLMTPERNRMEIGKYVNTLWPPVEMSTTGVGYYYPEGTFVLYCANEVPASAPCS
jgi:hypothetical protein